MEAIKISSSRTNYETIAKRLLAVNGFSKEHSFNPYNVKAYVIHNEFGVLCIAIGDSIQEALDNAVDNNCMDSCLINVFDRTDLVDACFLGNASEPFDLSHIGVLMEVSQYS